MSTNSTSATTTLPPYTQSDRYQVTFANAFSFRIGDNDCTLRFMIAEDPMNIDSSEIQNAVILTPRSAKVLAGILVDSILELEHALGGEIPARNERHAKLFQAAKAGWTSEAAIEVSSEQ